jgi:hypothetical protein
MRFKHGNIELINGDCMEYIGNMNDESFDWGIVDPPFGIGDFTRSTAHGNRIIRENYSRPKWNNKIPDKTYFYQLDRVTKKTIIFGANYYNCFGAGGALIWDKGERPSTLSRCEIASLSFQKKVDYVRITQLSGCLCNDGKRIHPCQKPITLYK